MGEVFRPTTQDTEAFMENIGFPVTHGTIEQVYPGTFRERRVFRVGDQVIKALPHTNNSSVELDNLRKLISHYQETIPIQGVGVNIVDDTNYMVITMPWLGINLVTLGAFLDMIEMGYAEEPSFSGFSERTISNLVHDLGYDHVSFLTIYKLVHGDIFQGGSPNNVVYHPGHERLFLVDAEALQAPNPIRIHDFGTQVQKIRRWMLESLVQ